MSLTEYLMSIVVFASVTGFVSFVAYPAKSEKTIKFATAVLLLYTVLTPVFEIISGIADGSIENIINPDYEYGDLKNEEYISVAENAFKEGVCKLICSKYAAKADEMNVFLYGFDFQAMRCEKIKVVLFGKSALLDSRGIAAYVTEQGLGICEVDIRLG